MLRRVIWFLAVVTALAIPLFPLGGGVTPVAAAPTTFNVTATRTSSGDDGLWSIGYCLTVITVCQPNQQTYGFNLPATLTANDIVSATLHLTQAGMQVHIPGSAGERHTNLLDSTCTTAMEPADFDVVINGTVEQSLAGVTTVYAMPGGPGVVRGPAVDTDVTNLVRAALGPAPGANSLSLDLRLDAPCNQAVFIFDTAVLEVTYSIIFDFGGFYAPVDNQPAFNQVNAGQAIPVKFSLGGNQGLTIFTASYPQSKKIDCISSALLDDIEETVTAGGSSLSYDTSSGRYIYTWKTDKAWAGTCRELNVKLTDGTEHRANFKFK